MNSPFSSLPEAVRDHAARAPNAPAILAPGRPSLAYGRLNRQIEEVGGALRSMAIGPRDRVAVVLPNGPEMVVAVLAIASHAVCAPMNPVHAARELEGYLDDLRPRALLTAVGFASEARHVASARGIRILEIEPVANEEAGLFVFSESWTGSRSQSCVGPDDDMLALFTSGTTARPKIVPLTHANVCKSAFSSAASLSLDETDRCLNILPLFHGHGLTATVLASLAVGASVVATPGCEVDNFFSWLKAFEPSWYSAVPTMHQAILAQARKNPEQASAVRLRLIRSASGPLPDHVLQELERTFATAVIEFYGMTETASSPIACNPLHPGKRKVGSVGVRMDLAVAIMDAAGNLLPGGETGEVCVRGASVTRRYDNDEAANRSAFLKGWFRTGDLGYFDDEGYLYLIGRSKELINRGGEKITPWEVDDVLLEHPAIADAVTFSIPHPTLGEDVAAAVVLRPQASATPREIRQSIVGRISAFKVPRQILIVKELPRGPTGKVNRIGLATKLGWASPDAIPGFFVEPGTPVEKMLAQCWSKVLQVERIGIHDDFFALGGDSLLVTHLVAEVNEKTKLEIDVAEFFATPTIAETARQLERSNASRPSPKIAPRSAGMSVPASKAQERLWQMQRALPGRPYFNVFCPLRCKSTLDVAVVERSIGEIVQRHEILRTTFAEIDGRCMQNIAPHLAVKLIFNDLGSLPESERKAIRHFAAQDAALFSFDLERGPLIRAHLFRLAQQDYLLLITLHGIVIDGWSIGILINELLTVYDALAAGAASPLTPLAIQYADFVLWQRGWRSEPDLVDQLGYWREQLREPPPLMWSADRPLPRIEERLRAERREVSLPGSLVEEIKRLCREEGFTLFVALVTAWQILLKCTSGQEDQRVATLVANRNRPGTDKLIGPLANTVILRTFLGGDPNFLEVLRRVRTTILAAFRNQDLPYEELVDSFIGECGSLFERPAQVLIALHNPALQHIKTDRRSFNVEEATNDLGPLVTPMVFDINLTLRETADGLVGACNYKPHLFDRSRIEALLGDFRDVLERMVKDPEQPISAIRLSPV